MSRRSYKIRIRDRKNEETIGGYKSPKRGVKINAKLLAFCFMLCAGIFFNCIVFSLKAHCEPYIDSAHGNTSYGVNRTGISSFNYSIGNCAHCHEQHASIGGAEPAPNTGDDAGPDNYLLFKDLWISPPQSNTFCFGCHTDVSSVQSSFSRTNYSYSYWAGGDTTLICPGSVYESFQFVLNNGTSQSNCSSTNGSAHMLRNIRNYITNRWNFPTDNTYTNPCSGCHNPHRAKRDTHTTTGRTDGSGYLILSSVSRPSQHSKDNNVWQLWGDQSGERMIDYGGAIPYQAPYRYNSTTAYEPDGSTWTDGRNLFDTVTFCLDCHQNALSSQRLGTTTAIDWSATGDIHGLAPTDCSCDYGDKTSPYAESTNYVLSCLDCHEPHGSRNEYLLRPEINGTQIPIFGGSQQ